ncbi:MAG: hypothetical protein HOP02_03535 [Methylococcaceae bacterium]|nr:hypothetical protein [Methylococcaceae bacterium]
MKFTKKIALAFVTVVFCNNVVAYSTEEERKKECKPPKMLEFTLPEYSQAAKVEVNPESEFSFKLSGGTDPEKIQVFAKDKALPVDIKSNTSFTSIKGKLPAAFTGQFVRLNVIVKTELGCMSRDGWLIKIANQPLAATAQPVVSEAQTAAQPSVVMEAPKE